ncbi:methyl-accepting chemotaxis protein [Massilia sp. YIM B02763]|uniref:methyl-accepting chemotaxis protein n=1 Tax=Massilia sp. YIM B02763 TaxID=3050130 RepID=UPI0025B71858|nr:methyl-accepting chemotaxis protein [Massilia sp. YIM B02763]MDN4054051.1 methyl-accepting chemotaxis protein [Massilia sp. YIM B02763]
MKLRSMKIGQRLALGFGVVLALLLLVAFTGFKNMSRLNDLTDKIVNDSNAKTEAANGMRDAQRRISVTVRDLILTTDEDGMAALAKTLDGAWDDYGRWRKRSEELTTNPEQRALLAKVKEAREKAMPIVSNIVTLARANRNDEAIALLKRDAVPAAKAWQEALNTMLDDQAARNETEQTRGKADYEQARVVLAVVSVLATLVAVAVAWFITRSITAPMRRAVDIARTVAGGDLTSRIEVDSTDETGELLAALKEMNGSLQTIVGRVRSGTGTLVTASGEIASGNLDLSSRTEQQASALEETASSMEELTATVKQNAENARQANQLAKSASDVAKRGGAVVADVVTTMDSIHESASKIVDIIGVIDGIAFQTNILALNAAVEAARAGEQGRGFAVVASEVRNLAQRSAAAAKEIKALIGDSVGKVDEGSRLVQQAGSTMEDIVTSVRRVTDIMAEISSASHEQEAGIEQINQAIGEMDSVTQQNAALVEEAAAAAQSMQEQSNALEQLVSTFKIAGGGTAVAAKARPAQAAARAVAVVAKPANAQRAAPARQEEEWETF